MTDSILQHFQQYGKDRSWFELAELFNISPNLTRKQRSDKVRRIYSRTFLKQQNTPIMTKTTEDPFLTEFRAFLKSKQSKTVYQKYEGDPNNILVIGDTHIPYQHPDYLDFVTNLQRKWNCGKVIHIGDLVDFAGTTFHDTIPELPSAGYELEYTKIELEKWKQAFPDLTVIWGNHDRRIARKLSHSSVPNAWYRTMNEVLDLPWTFTSDLVYNGIYFCHGEGATASITALQKQMPVVQGHRHSETYINFPAKNLFAVQTAIGVNRERLAFDYAKVDPKEWTLGATVILNNQIPIIEKL